MQLPKQMPGHYKIVALTKQQTEFLRDIIDALLIGADRNAASLAHKDSNSMILLAEILKKIQPSRNMKKEIPNGNSK